MARGLKYGSWAGPRYKAAVNWTQGKLMGVFSPKLSEKIADEAVMTTALMMGGNAMILPIGAAEHYKVPIVSGLNVMMGDKTPPETIEQAPKQTWTSLIEGRLVAWSAVFAAIIGARVAVPKTFELFPNEVGSRAHELLQKMRKRPVLTDEAMKQTKSFQYGHLGAFDVFATIAAASILYVGGHFFARKQAEKKADQHERLHATHEIPATLDEAPRTMAESRIVGDKLHQGVVSEASLKAQRTT
jgi:hypothetical protein